MVLKLLSPFWVDRDWHLARALVQCEFSMVAREIGVDSIRGRQNFLDRRGGELRLSPNFTALRDILVERKKKEKPYEDVPHTPRDHFLSKSVGTVPLFRRSGSTLRKTWGCFPKSGEPLCLP